MNGPLDGLPIGIKDNFCTKNLRTTCCSRMLEPFVPKYNATVVDRTEKAGGIVLGQAHYMFSRFLILQKKFHEIFFVLFFYKVKFFCYDQKCWYNCLSYVAKKDTLQPSKKWIIKFREKYSWIQGSWKTCEELVTRQN